MSLFVIIDPKIHYPCRTPLGCLKWIIFVHPKLLLANKILCWPCSFEYPQPTFQKLMKEQVMEPFFVFQVCLFQLHFHFSLIKWLFPIYSVVFVFKNFTNHFLLPFIICFFCSWHVGFLCGPMVFGWVLVLQFVHSIHAVHVWVDNGKKSFEDFGWA